MAVFPNIYLKIGGSCLTFKQQSKVSQLKNSSKSRGRKGTHLSIINLYSSYTGLSPKTLTHAEDPAEDGDEHRMFL